MINKKAKDAALSDTIRSGTEKTLQQARAEPDGADCCPTAAASSPPSTGASPRGSRTWVAASPRGAGRGGASAVSPPETPRRMFPAGAMPSSREAATARSVTRSDGSDLDGFQHECVIPGFVPGLSEPPPEIFILNDRVERQLNEVQVLLADCETLEHIEARTNQSNHARQGKMQELRKLALKLQAEAEEVRALGDEAAVAMNAAKSELADAREAMIERQRSYQECRLSRSTVIHEQHELKARQEANIKAEFDAKLDGMGDLDAKGEADLHEKVAALSKRGVSETLTDQTLSNKVSLLEEQYKRIRLASHDPASIETPQDMMLTMLTMEERGAERQEQVEEVRQRNEALVAEQRQIAEELKQFMFFGSSSIALAEAERGLEVPLEEVSAVCTKFRSRHASIRKLVNEAKIGIALLLSHSQLPTESPSGVVQDHEVLPSLDRIERYLTTCLSHIQIWENDKIARAEGAEWGSAPVVVPADATPAEAAPPDAAPAEASVEEVSSAAASAASVASHTSVASRTEGAPAAAVERRASVPRFTSRRRQSAIFASAPKGAHNIRIKTQEELDALVADTPSEEDIYDDDDAPQLTRRRASMVKARQPQPPQEARKRAAARRPKVAKAAAADAEPSGAVSVESSPPRA
eukprot:CAMPEP_0181178250 /NCGR_PEP_ID=MMETSP1096-20121128/5622_1 /TAXON_ID=156174 ORGANISM="Chrysochromulina ericina, Strain CCMP281" /NCGR_SAMPLE_ID=MMETSP1096 /ASSEMBLY_ACC=CAM_ASM_000453 /LENGTH=639 /DNA_ID=CAMNT_0023266511 /DNA_START=21 /DNA_END=1940 /DNA_ORIENTATION=+